MSEKIKAVRGNARCPERVREWLEGQGAFEFPAGSASKLNDENLLYFVKPDRRVSFLRKEYDYFVDVEELPRWRALQGKQYYYITSLYTINKIPDHYQNFNDRHYEVGNYFATLEEAEEMRNNLLFQLTSKRV